jgi:cardiolipin synthase (CMP-forming)
MTTLSNPPTQTRTFSVPNLLTYARIAAVPAVVGCMYGADILQGGLWLRWVALVIFIAAGVTDFFDGYFARAWGQNSTFGRMLDPIADKLLVASCLLMLAANGTIKGWSLWAAIVILCREILVSGLREYLAGLRVRVPVSQLAKWKTGIQMVAIGVLLVGDAGPAILPVQAVGELLLWIAALLTLVTGYDYLRAGLHHMTDDRPRRPAKTVKPSRVL